MSDSKMLDLRCTQGWYAHKPTVPQRLKGFPRPQQDFRQCFDALDAIFPPPHPSYHFLDLSRAPYSIQDYCLRAPLSLLPPLIGEMRDTGEGEPAGLVACYRAVSLWMSRFSLGRSIATLPTGQRVVQCLVVLGGEMNWQQIVCECDGIYWGICDAALNTCT